MTDGVVSADALVIGAGVVGCSIARELTRYDLAVQILEARADVCDATSKANSGIVHTGFDAPPASLEARMLRESRDLWPQYAAELRVDYRRVGAVMAALDDGELRSVSGDVLHKAHQNDMDVRVLTRDEVHRLAPNVSPRAVGGLFVEAEGICDPFVYTINLCASALRNGARLALNAPVESIALQTDRARVVTRSGQAYEARMVVNAAGLWSDTVARMIGDVSFSISGRKGQFLVTHDDLQVERIVLPVPNKISKGILVTPAVFGGTLLGPTAEDNSPKADVATTSEGLRLVRDGAARLIPRAANATTIHQYAGVRAVGSTNDYIIQRSAVDPRLLHVAGIRSTGLSASPAIGRHVASLVAGSLGAGHNASFEPHLPVSVAAHDGRVVCLCRGVTRGSVLDALKGPVPARTLDGIKRRTGVMLGGCQGSRCAPILMDMLANAHAMDPAMVERNEPGSYIALRQTRSGTHA